MTAGSTVSHYVIGRQLGAGGMGIVYEAEDIRLGRRVALKVLPPQLAHDSGALDRFRHEARTASALNHPNICTIYDIDSHEGVTFIAMELLDGVSLKAYMAGKVLDANRIAALGIQIASALDAAGRKGIVHRDIKPANIFVLASGDCKILDFGLAKLTRDPETDATQTAMLTMPGQIMGTLAYMSPEQARGEDLDTRTDLFSVGAVLYEMATGRPPFAAKSAAALHAEILMRNPELPSTYNPLLQPELERVIIKALEKDRELRYQTAADLRADLKRLGVASIPSTRSAPAKATVRRGLWFLMGATGLALIAGAYWLGSNRHASRTPDRTFTQLTHDPGYKYSPSLSPDGKSFVYESRGDIFLQRVGGANPLNLTADSPAFDGQPAFSPDGERIAFFSARQGGGIFVMGATGENVKRVGPLGYHPGWSPDGKFLAYTSARFTSTVTTVPTRSVLYILDLKTGQERRVGPENAVQPSWSPHGHRIAYFGRPSAGTSTDIWTVSAEGGEPVAVTQDDYFDMNPVWSPDASHLYFASDRAGSMNLWRVPIEERSGRVLGRPEQITTPSTFSFMPAPSSDGQRIVYLQQSRTSNLQALTFDSAREAASTVSPVTQGARLAWTPDLSPDGQWLVWASRGREDLFLVRPDGTGYRQLTDDSFSDRAPRWSPDGKRIGFYSDRSGKRQVWTIRPDGSDLDQITDTADPLTYIAWSPDGQRIASSANKQIVIFDANARKSRQPLQRMTAPLDQVYVWSWSPDGKMLAIGGYHGFESAGMLVYAFGTGRFEQITNFGFGAMWLNDNRRLLFVDETKIYVVDRETHRVKPVHSVAPQRLGWELGLSKDNLKIFFNLDILESDVWLMTEK